MTKVYQLLTKKQVTPTHCSTSIMLLADPDKALTQYKYEVSRYKDLNDRRIDENHYIAFGKDEENRNVEVSLIEQTIY